MATLNLEEFKSLVKTDSSFAVKITEKKDIIDIDNGHMLIHKTNIDKYLEAYACKDEEDLENTLWFNMGIFVQIVD